jgi:hypothetical protein
MIGAFVNGKVSGSQRFASYVERLFSLKNLQRLGNYIAQTSAFVRDIEQNLKTMSMSSPCFASKYEGITMTLASYADRLLSLTFITGTSAGTVI